MVGGNLCFHWIRFSSHDVNTGPFVQFSNGIKHDGCLNYSKNTSEWKKYYVFQKFFRLK
jgi:hypothetical protein